MARVQLRCVESADDTDTAGQVLGPTEAPYKEVVTLTSQDPPYPVSLTP
jgi:hypothetical protein